MADIHIGLSWWPPDPDEPLGEERARELVQRLKEIAGPVVSEAEANLRERSSPSIQIVRGGAPLSYLVRTRFGDELRSLCVGTVYQVHAGDPESNWIHLHRDGALRWRRD